MVKVDFIIIIFDNIILLLLCACKRVDCDPIRATRTDCWGGMEHIWPCVFRIVRAHGHCPWYSLYRYVNKEHDGKPRKQISQSNTHSLSKTLSLAHSCVTAVKKKNAVLFVITWK